jgi:hypothetical protein
MNQVPASPSWLTRGALFFLLGLLFLPVYIYFHPVRWEAFWINFPATFWVFRPYPLLAHARDFALVAWLGGLGYGLGRLILDRLLPLPAPTALAVPMGWGAVGFVMFGLNLLHQIALWKITLCLSLLTVISLVYLYTRHGWRFFPWVPRREAWCLGWRALSLPSRVMGFLLAVSLFYAFVSALMPPTQTDGLRYHLTIPKLYLAHGGFTVFPDIAFSNFPFLVEYLYMIPLAFGSISGPKLLHVSYFVLTLLLVYRLGAALGGKETGFFAACLLGTTPFLPIFASWSFIEFGLVCYTVLAFTLIVESIPPLRTPGVAKGAIAAGLAGGLMVSCKYTALASLVFLGSLPFLYALVADRASLRRALGFGLGMGLTGLAVASPWFIKNWIVLGNPIYPFAHTLFPTPNWTEFNAFFFSYHAGIKGSLNAVQQLPLGYQILDFFTLPFRVTLFPGDQPTHPETFGEWSTGAMWLLVIPFLFFKEKQSARRWLHVGFAFLLYLTWAYSYRETRFLLPVLAIAAPVAALALLPLIQSWRWNAFLLIVFVFYGQCEMGYRLYIPGTYAPWWVVSGRISQEEYLTEWNDSIRVSSQAFQWLRENTSTQDTVLLHGIDRTFYCPNPYIGGDWFNTDPLIRASWEHPRPDALAKELRERGVKYLITNYGNIFGYNNEASHYYYRLFRLPPALGLPILKELYAKEPSRLFYPYAYGEWKEQYHTKLQTAEAMAPNVAALETLLNGGYFEEVFRYDPNPDKPYDGVYILKVSN